MPSEIERLNEWEDGDSCYRTSCDCMSTEDALTFSIAYDREDKTVWLELDVDTYHDSRVWDDPAWSHGIRGFWQRLKSCWQLLTEGHLKYTAGFIFRGDAQIDEFCETIQKAKARCKEVNDAQ